jgi:hypothetical protein
MKITLPPDRPAALARLLLGKNAAAGFLLSATERREAMRAEKVVGAHDGTHASRSLSNPIRSSVLRPFFVASK